MYRSKGISPIVSSIILMIIAISIAFLVVAYVNMRAQQVSSIIQASKANTLMQMKESLSIVFNAIESDGTIVLALMNTGSITVKILGIYVNGEKADYVEAKCAEGGTYTELPILIRVEDLCILRIEAPKQSEYVLIISTENSNYEIRVYGK